MQEPKPVEKLLEEYELALLQPDIRKSALVRDLLSESFVEFGSSGRVFDKAQNVAALQAETPVKVSASGFAVRFLAPHVALVTYRTVRHSEPAVHSLRSSVWQLQEGRWQLVFHQGTPTA